MRAVSIDPGLDVTGIAAWSFERVPARLDEALVCLAETQEIQTSPSDELHERLATIAFRLRAFLGAWKPNVVYVEMPAIEGTYARGSKATRAGTNRLYMAIGSILAVTGPRTVARKAIRQRKAQRNAFLEHAARMAGIELPQGPRGGARQDTWDAIWLGAEALLERGNRDF